MFYGASKSDYLSGRDYKQKGAIDAVYGRKLWTEFRECVILKEQHRFGDDADGQALYDIVRKLTHTRNVDGSLLSDDDIASLADTLNNRAISPTDLPGFLKRAPKAVVLRHSIRPVLTKILVLHHAAKANSRVCLWRASDRASRGKKGKYHLVPLDNIIRCVYVSNLINYFYPTGAGKPINSFVLQKIEKVADNETPPSIQYFFPGIPYRFLRNLHPVIGCFNNGSCIGDSLVLDDREPDDDMTGDFRVLKYQPKALIVRLPDRKLGKLCGDGITEDCIPLFPTNSKVIDFTLDCSMKLYADPRDTTTDKTIKFKRYAFPVDTAITYTDFFAQGVSFRGDPHFLHLGVSEKQGYRRANLLVPISRPAVLSDVVLLHPLWPRGDHTARLNIIRLFKKALTPDPDYESEMERLQQLHSNTVSTHYSSLMGDKGKLCSVH